MMFLSTCLLNFLVLVIICHVSIGFQRFLDLLIIVVSAILSSFGALGPWDLVGGPLKLYGRGIQFSIIQLGGLGE